MTDPNAHSGSDSHVPDLARFDDEFAEAPVEENDFAPVPDGKYQVNVEKVEITTAKASGNALLKWMLRILGPSHAGRVLWRNNVMVSRENIKWLKNDLHTCGLELSKLSDLPAHLEQLLDVKLEVTLRSKGDSTNVYLNRRLVLDDINEGEDRHRGSGRGGLPF